MKYFSLVNVVLWTIILVMFLCGLELPSFTTLFLLVAYIFHELVSFLQASDRKV